MLQRKNLKAHALKLNLNSTEENSMNAEKAVRDFLKGISETNGVYFVGSTIKNPIEYKIGETMTFKLKVKTESGDVPVPYIYYTCEGDDGVKTVGYSAVSEDGWFYFDTSISRAGFVHVTAKACDENKEIIDDIDIFEGGAGADIDRITIGTEEPEDYLEFWDWLKGEACKTEPEILFEEKFEHESCPGFEICDMRIKAAGSSFASFWLTYPKNAKKGSLKLRIITHGYGFPHGDEYYAEPDMMTVWINAHAVYHRQPDEYYEKLSNGELKAFGFDNNENSDPKTAYWTKMFMRDLQVVRFIKNHPLLDGFIRFEGSSMGAMRACNLAAHTGIADECGLGVPWFADLGGIENCGRLRGWRPDYKNGLRYFDTAIAAKYLKCPVKIEAGLGDYVCPPSGEAAMYNLITAQKEIVFIQNQTHPYRPHEPLHYTLCEK